MARVSAKDIAGGRTANGQSPAHSSVPSPKSAPVEDALTEASCCARHAVSVDPDIKRKNLARLKRIEGQVRGIQKMVDEERWCADTLTQIASVQEALRSVSRELMRNHLKHCVADAAQSDAESANAVYDELVELMFKYSR